MCSFVAQKCNSAATAHSTQIQEYSEAIRMMQSTELPAVCDCSRAYLVSISIVNESFKRDINYLFKFRIGDKVKKAWRWNKLTYSRYQVSDVQDLCPIGTVGTVRKILSNGTLCIEWKTEKHPRLQWHFGASEFDVIESPETVECKHSEDCCSECCKRVQNNHHHTYSKEE